ncbi:MAG: DUF2149 domain-containing protein [Lachnospiraceae bacterium]|nr:DUF2149 domain-containing protein [Lachnospiraceae bacterium]
MKSALNYKNYFEEGSGESPMDNISNMSDAMLVLAVGIMLALVINWKIDIKSMTNEEVMGDIVNEENLEEYEFEKSKEVTDVKAEDVESNYVKSGTVYTDTATGKTYVVLDE